MYRLNFPRSRSMAAMVVAGVLMLSGTATAGPQEDLFEAIRRDDTRKVEALLLRGVSTNAVDPTAGPAIVAAAMERSAGAVQALLLSPATDIDARNPAGETALMYASLFGDLDTVKLLVARRAQINQPGWTALHYAAGSGQLSVVQYLLEQNAYIDAPSPNGTTPLMMAAREGRVTVAEYLVREGADPTLRNEPGLDAADYFMRAGNTRQAEWMRDESRAWTRKHGGAGRR